MNDPHDFDFDFGLSLFPSLCRKLFCAFFSGDKIKGLLLLYEKRKHMLKIIKAVFQTGTLHHFFIIDDEIFFLHPLQHTYS